MNKIAALEVNNITKAFNKEPALNNISFNIQKGEIIGFIGLNGTGKTTLIKSILNLLQPDSGTTAILGEDSNNIANKKNISYLPEKFTPSPLLKGREFIELALRTKQKHASSKKLAAILKDLDFPSNKINEQIKHYSKGMVQKIGLAAIFLAESPLLILDEPMSGLDPLTRAKLKNLLIEHKKSGKTTFFSSHILSDIDEICDKVILLNKHKITFIGTPKELKKKEKTTKLEKAFLQAIKN